MAGRLILGIDVGTTSVKAGVMDATGQIVAALDARVACLAKV